MNKNISRIIKEKLIRINLTNKEFLWKLSKSINQNNNISNKIKLYNNFIYVKRINSKNFISRKHKICIFTGKYNSVLKKFNVSRDQAKKFILSNKFTNIKKNNW
jgi:ribosomal protein S14